MMDHAPPPPLHELEAEVMDTVWDLDEASVRTVMDVLNRDAPKPRAYTTYMTILGRLHGKGLLERRREGKTDVYRAIHSRTESAVYISSGVIGYGSSFMSFGTSRSTTAT